MKRIALVLSALAVIAGISACGGHSADYTAGFNYATQHSGESAIPMGDTNMQDFLNWSGDENDSTVRNTWCTGAQPQAASADWIDGCSDALAAIPGAQS